MARLTPAGAGAVTGTVVAYPAASIPRGWLHCNGAAVSRALYPNLFSLLGTTYGAGDTTTTFNVPDLRGEFLRGQDDGRGVDPSRSLGSSQADDNKSHSHGASSGGAGGHSHSGSANAAGSHTHGLPLASRDYSTGPVGASGYTGPKDYTEAAGDHSHSLSINAVANHSHSVSVGSSGGGEARPRNVAMRYYIKT
jgi:microcystin-dependent protein